MLEHDARFHALIEHSADGLALFDAEWKLIYVSPGLARMAGYSADEMRQQDPIISVHPDDRATVLARRAALLAEPGATAVLEFRARGGDGGWRWLESGTQNLLHEPAVGAIVAHYRDITARREAEAALRASEERNRIISELTSDFALALRLDPDGAPQIEWATSALARLTGYSLDEFIARGWQTLIHPDDQAQAEQLIAALTARQTAACEVRLIHRDGQTRWLQLYARPAPAGAEGGARAYLAARDITQHKRDEEIARRRASVFVALYESARDLAEAHDLDTLLPTLVGRALELVRAPVAGIYLFDPERRDLELVHTTGYPVPRGRRLALGEGLAGRVAAQRQVINLPDYSAWPHRALKHADIPFAAVVGVPMLFRGEVVGVLVADELRPSTRRFSEADEQLLALFAGLAAGAVHSARLLAAQRQRLSELEAVNRISTGLRAWQSVDEMLPPLLDQILALLGAPHGALNLVEGDMIYMRERRGLFEPYQGGTVGSGIAGRVIATNTPHVTREFASDPHLRPEVRPIVPPGWGGVVVPIRGPEAVIGALYVGVDLPREITPAEVSLLTTIAEMAGNTLQRMQLLEQARQRLEYFEALHHVDMAISGSLDLRVTLMVLLDQLRAKLNVDAAAVLLLNPAQQVFEYAVGRGFRTRYIEQARARPGSGPAAGLSAQPALWADPAGGPHAWTQSELMEREGFAAFRGLPLVAKGQPKGVLAVYHRAPLHPTADGESFLEAMASQAAIAVDSAQLFDRLQRGNIELVQAYDATIEGWSRLLDRRDGWPAGHAQQLADRAVDLGRELGLSAEDLSHLRRGALLHDIGLLLVPDAILHKPGPLDEAEWAEVRCHPEYARELLSPIAFLRPALDVPVAHHERWDGSGYPRGLKGEDIPLAARLFAVVDVWDALTAPRPHRAAWSTAQARDHLAAYSGVLFDPQIVALFLRTAEPLE